MFVYFSMPINCRDPDSDKMTEWAIRVYDTGTAEDYCKWQITFAELAEASTWDMVDKQETVLQTVLRCKAKTCFNVGFNSMDPLTSRRNHCE